MASLDAPTGQLPGRVKNRDVPKGTRHSLTGLPSGDGELIRHAKARVIATRAFVFGGDFVLGLGFFLGAKREISAIIFYIVIPGLTGDPSPDP